MTTLNTMVQQVQGLLDTIYISDWENQFLRSIVEQTSDGSDTSRLTAKQVQHLTDIHRKHFAEV